MNRVKIIAHRGANSEFPENTIPAFERALEIGVDAIELDLLSTRDGKMVVRHSDLIFYGDRWHYVRDLTHAELSQIDVGQGEHAPLLDEVFDRFHKRCPIFVDVKTHGMNKLLIPFLKQRKARKEVHITSFLHTEIGELRHRCPEVGRSIVMAAMPVRFQEIVEYAGVKEISLFRGYLSRDTVRRLRDYEMRVRVYPVNLLWEAELFSKWGVAAVFTDQPADLKSLRR